MYQKTQCHNRERNPTQNQKHIPLYNETREKLMVYIFPISLSPPRLQLREILPAILLFHHQRTFTIHVELMPAVPATLLTTAHILNHSPLALRTLQHIVVSNGLRERRSAAHFLDFIHLRYALSASVIIKQTINVHPLDQSDAAPRERIQTVRRLISRNVSRALFFKFRKQSDEVNLSTLGRRRYRRRTNDLSTSRLHVLVHDAVAVFNLADR